MIRPIATLSAIFVGVLALAQNAQPPAQQHSNGSAKFTANTQLVVEIVSVKDKSGKIVEGLTAKDFTVTEDGKPQDIKFCEFQKLSDDPLPAIPETPETPKSDAAGSGKPALEAPKPEVAAVTQHAIMPEKPGDIRYRDRRLLALYFDMSAMPIPDQLRALAAAQKFIHTQMTGPDLMCVIVYNEGNVQILQDFTGDRDLLSQTIDK